ncbi:MAG: HTH domain-containing protein [Albidovulum sp.]
MRAARLLQILLLLQNRGRMTSSSLATELEVTPRTILRDVDAMTEAGLPVIVHRGNRGGIELGFNYRTRLTGLSVDEAEALALWLSNPPPELEDLGMTRAALHARAKLIESFPDQVRAVMAKTVTRFRPRIQNAAPPDPRIAAIAGAIRLGRILRLRARSPYPQTVRPLALSFGATGWQLIPAENPDAPIAIADWGDINIAQDLDSRSPTPEERG